MLTPSRRLSIAAFVAASLAIAFSFLFIANRARHKQTSSKTLPAAAKSLGANGPVSAMADAEVMKAYGQLPLSFEANQGQSAADVKYLTRADGYVLSLRGQEADLTFHQAPAARRVAANRLKPYRARRVPATPEKFSTLRMRLDGSNPSAEVTGLDRTATKINYFLGNDPKKWHTEVPAYSKVQYAGIYPGVDLMFYGNRRELEYDFVVAPGADPKSIALNVEGARKVYLNANGNLILDVPGGEVKFKKPDVYQDFDGTRREIAGNYAIKNHHEVRFALADYDRSQPLTIDPVVTYSTYVGGSGSANGGDMAMGLALDSAGDAYIGGVTFSADLTQVNGVGPVPASLGLANSSGFVAELNPTGTAALYLTYLGGETQDGVLAIAVDSNKNIYVTGFTQSSTFPLSQTNTPFEPHPPASVSSDGSAFVTRLDPTKTLAAQLVYSSYLGGGGSMDQGNGIAVDANGNAYVTGVTLSATGFPIANASTAPFSTTLLSPAGNAFVTEVNTNGSGQPSLLFSSYLGGNGTGPVNFPFGDFGAGITVDSSSNAYVVGTTTSGLSFPNQGTQITSCAKNADSTVFVAEIGLATPTTPVLAYSTCLAGTTADVGQAIALGPNNLVYLTGATFSTDFPVTAHTIPLGFPGPPPVGFPNASESVAFVSTVNTTNGTLGYSTLLGGSNGDGGFGIAVDSAGIAYVTGLAGSPDFPITPGALQSTRTNILGSVFVSKINAPAGGQGGADLLYSTYFGGNGDGAAADPDAGNGIAVSGTNAYIGGQATPGLNTTAGVYQTATKNATGVSAFVAELPLIATLTATPNPLAFGTQPLNTPSAAMTVTVTNNSTGPLPVTFAVTGANAGDFVAATAGTATPCGATLAAAGTCTIGVVFTPTVVAAEAATLTVGTAPNTVAVALTGTGSTLTATPNPLAFGNQTLNMPSAAMSVTVTNNSAGTLPVAFAVTGANAGDFAAATARTTTPCGPTLAATGTCTIGVIFTPTLVPAGAETATLTIGTAPNSVAVALTGTGTAATGTFAVTAPATASLTSGVSGAIPVTVTGSGGFTGTVNLTCAGGTANVSSCTMMPTSVSITAGTPTQMAAANVVATISLVVPPDTLKTPPASSLRQVIFLALGIAMLFMIPITQRRRARLGMVAAMLVFVVVAGCGGGGPSTGTGTVTITGTAPGSPALPPQTATVNLTITK
jgi:Beta-propeller repeat